MLRQEKYQNHGLRKYICKECENQQVVREGLAYSPSDMARLTERGMPVNGLNTSQAWVDGEENPSFHVGSERSRFVDVAELWEEHMNIRDKARAAHKASKKNTKSE